MSPSWSALFAHAAAAGVPPAGPPPGEPPPGEPLPGVPPPGPSPLPTEVTTGESRRVVKALNLPARTRSLRRVGCGLLTLPPSRRATALGTTTTSFLRDARRGFANAERPLGARKMIVLAFRSDLKFLPRMVSRAPTLIRIGITRVMEGVDAFFLAAGAAGTLTTRAVADSASRQMMKRRRIALPPIDDPSRCLSQWPRHWTRSPRRQGAAGKSGAPGRA